MNSANVPSSADAALKDAAPAEALPLDPALAAALPGVPVPQAFLQFMQMDAAAPAEPMPEPAGGAGAQEDGAEGSLDAAAQPLLAAMTMPLMPSMMAMPAALPAAVRLAAGMQDQQPAAVAVAAAAAVPAAAGAGAGTLELPPATAATAAAAGALAQAVLPAADGMQAVRTSTAAPSAQTAATPQQAAVAPAPAPAPAPAGDGAGADGQAAPGNGGGGAGNGTAAGAGFGIAAPAAPNAAARDGATLTLSGPPTAWRQSLQQALGERLNLQLGKNAEQAVIRLEPPMLGRVEISIRHAAGSLEVNITATHSEVLRQLNTVSDNLRNDLAQRQYTDVSVNVSQAASRVQAQAGGQAGGFGADAQGRGRQQDQDQDERTPGAALAEANQSTAAFSLNGRA